MDQIQLVRLVSGEEILAKIEESDGFVKFEKPHIIIPTQGKGIALMPWCPYSTIQDDGVTVPSDKVMFTAKPHVELAKEYTTATTGIELPRAGDVAGTIGQQMITED